MLEPIGEHTTRFCGHGYHAECDGTAIVDAFFSRPCACPCHNKVKE